MNFAAGWRFAAWMGFPLNVFISINWSLTHSDLDEIARNGLLREAIRAWIARHAPGVPFAWVEVREKPPGQGEGVHLALHIPTGLMSRFMDRIEPWVALHSDLLSSNVVDARRIDHRWWEVRDYMLKAGEAAVQRRFNTKRFRKNYQGVIAGPRIRVSNALGRTARGAEPSWIDIEVEEG